MSSRVAILLVTFFSFVFALNAEEIDFFEDKTLQDGFLTIAYSHSSDKVFIGLEKSLINKSLLFQSSLPQGIGSNDIGLDRGQLGQTRLITFERFGNKLLLKQMNTKFRAYSSNLAEQASIDEAFADSVIAGFEIAHEDSSKIFIDYTDFLFSDIHGISQRLARTSQGTYKLDKLRSGVYMPRTKSFVKNTELEALVTFTGMPNGQFIRDVTPDAKSVSVHLHHSFIELPDNNYKSRVFHPYSGFWKHSYYDYSVAIENDLEQKLIPRHRLAKKDPTSSSSEAVEPIVYYLDPGIPEPIMSALREGALWWDEAFQAAGYKNAFQVKILPEDADPMDIRYNVIQWVHRATRGWSYGSSVVDPRTGEIIKGHVTLGSLRVRQDFLIASGFSAPYTNEDADISQELQLALNRIKQLSAHEVGHTLGIAHNFAASENNRASVMDYPHPLIKLVNDEIDLSDAYAKGIGEWDKYVVKYGYQDFPDTVDEQRALLSLVNDTMVRGLLYKSDPDARIPKRASADGHLWDNGSDPLTEFTRVSELRAFAIDQFGKNNLPEQVSFSDLERRFVPIYYSHRYQLDALVKQISGIEYQYTVKQGDTLPQVRHIDGKEQVAALKLLLSAAGSDYLTLPQDLLTLIPPKAYGDARSRESMPSRMGIAFDPISAAEAISAYSLRILLESERLNRLAFQHGVDNDVPSVKLLSEMLFEAIVQNNDANNLSQRLKMVALSVFFESLADQNLAPDVKLDMQASLLDYEKWLTKHQKKLSNKVLLKHVKLYWQSGDWALSVPTKTLPPGSPI